MGVIWVQTNEGQLIHLPVLGPDINTPDTLPRISYSLIPIEAIQSGVIFPLFIEGIGIVMFDFTVPGRVGSCTRCGSCCTHPIDCCHNQNKCGYIHDLQYNVHKCKHLIINPGDSKLGEPGQTSCAIYGDIINKAKGCLHGPQSKKEIMPWMSRCGFKFKE